MMIVDNPESIKSSQCDWLTLTKIDLLCLLKHFYLFFKTFASSQSQKVVVCLSASTARAHLSRRKHHSFIFHRTAFKLSRNEIAQELVGEWNIVVMRSTRKGEQARTLEPVPTNWTIYKSLQMMVLTKATLESLRRSYRPNEIKEREEFMSQRKMQKEKSFSWQLQVSSQWHFLSYAFHQLLLMRSDFFFSFLSAISCAMSCCCCVDNDKHSSTPFVPLSLLRCSRPEKLRWVRHGKGIVKKIVTRFFSSRSMASRWSLSHCLHGTLVTGALARL